MLLRKTLLFEIVLILKYTFQTICQRRLFHLLSAPFSTAKVFTAISSNPESKAKNKQLKSPSLLNASPCAPLTPVYQNHHFWAQRGEGGPGQGQAGASWAAVSRDAGLGSPAAPSASQPLPSGEACYLAFAVALPLP